MDKSFRYVHIESLAAAQAERLLSELSRAVHRTRFHADSDSIHDLRVAWRRLRQLLRCFAQLFDQDQIRKIRRAMRGIRALAGEVRNLDVAIAAEPLLLTPFGCSLPARLTYDRYHRYQKLTRRLRSWQRDENEWRRALRIKTPADPGCWVEGGASLTNARSVLPQKAADFIAIANQTLAEQPTPRQLHQLRILTKRFRYTLEFFESCYDDELDLHLQTLREMQQDLGELNDLATTREVYAFQDLGCQGQEYFGRLDAHVSAYAAALTANWRTIFRDPNFLQRLAEYLSGAFAYT